MIRSILKSLLKPEAYPEATTRVELVQTHVSWIFLTDRHAYKIKKPVDFGFLNFSTIDRRRFYCNQEVRLNRRLCPDMYEGVVELRQTNGGATFCDTGTVIDYAVKMKRLPADRMLNILVERNSVASADMRVLANIIADFHHHAPTSLAIAAYGSPERILTNWSENLDQLMPFEKSTLPAEDRERFRSWCHSFMSTHSELFKARCNNGFVRECDGDIHLENICLTDGTFYIFDCIEFNDRFRCCDTASDLAFLLMDLDMHQRHDLAETVCRTYLEASNDHEAQRLFDFYKMYCAIVRGKVESLKLNDHGLTSPEHETATLRAKRYFRLARGYLERQHLKPTLFITCGLMGVGKSSLATQLSFELGIHSYNSDVVRKQLAGISSETPVETGFSEGLYSPDISRITYQCLNQLAETELHGGRSVILDACFIHAAERGACAELAKRFGAECFILHLSCNDNEHRRRLVERSTGGKSVSDGRIELLATQRAQLEVPTKNEGQLLDLNASATIEQLVDTIYERLG